MCVCGCVCVCVCVCACACVCVCASIPQEVEQLHKMKDEAKLHHEEEIAHHEV